MSGASPASDLSQRLAQNVEAVCHTYLSNGRRAGGYWVVGDAENNPGSSLFVRLHGPDSGKGAAGKWTDYVAAKVMLRLGAEALSHNRSSASTQHNGVLREVV